MKEAVRKLWGQALRSDEYAQTDGKLRKGDAFCCLGVLCDLAVKAGVVTVEELPNDFGDPNIFAYGAERETEGLPAEVMDWAGLSSADPEVEMPDDWFEGETYPEHLSALNDISRLSFREIADLIDAQL